MFEVKNLHSTCEKTKVLKGLSLKVSPGETHVIMGPNGCGKSTFSKVVLGDEEHEVTQGDIFYEINGNKKSILEMNVDERVKNGVFMAFQYPVEIQGISNYTLLKSAFNSICKHQGIKELDDQSFKKMIESKAQILGLDLNKFIYSDINENLSGGEKKKSEILHMMVLNPKLIFLDETDSGLDIDATKKIFEKIQEFKTKDNAFIVITHYKKIVDFLKPDYVHIMKDGKIVQTGDEKLAHLIEEKGYENIK